MGRNIKILITSFVLGSLYGLYLYGIPAVLNLPKSTQFIENTILKETGYKVLIKNPSFKMGHIPSLKFEADKISLLNDDNTDALTILSPNINIRLLPLIYRQINIKSFAAQNISANINLDTDSKLKLGQYELKPLKKTDFSLKLTNTNLESFNIYLSDKIQSKNIDLKGDYLIIKDFTENKHLNLSTSANLNTGSKTSTIKTDLDIKLPISKPDSLNISGHIINLDLSDFSSYAKSISKGEIKSLSGVINLTAETNNTIKTSLYIKNPAIKKEKLSESIYHNGVLTINSNINPIDNGIFINEMTVVGNGINAFLSGKISKLNSKFPILNLKIGIDKSKAESIIALLPPSSNICPDMDFLLLKQTGFWADASANIEVKGKADLPDVYGNVMVTNAYMVKPIANAQKATIKLGFKGDKFALDVDVPTSKTEDVKVKGIINLDKERSADLYITSTPNVDLKTAQIVLNPLHRILHFDIGPVPIMDIKGKGGINLHILGTRKNPHGWGNFWFNSGDIKFLDIHNLNIKNASGNLKFDNQDTYFESKTANLNGKPISVKGTCALDGTMDFNVLAKNQDLKALLNTVKTSPMLIDIQNLISPIENASGPANFKLNLTGQVKDVNDIEFNKNIFAKGVIELLSNSIKLKDMPAVKASGIINFKNLDTDFNLKSAINSSIINIEGKTINNNIDVKFKSDKFNLHDGASILPIKTKIDISSIYSNFSGKYRGKISVIEPDKLTLTGKIYQNNSSKSPLKINNTNFELNNSNFKLHKLNGNFKGSPFTISLNIAKLLDAKQSVNAYFNSNSFDTEILNDEMFYYIAPQLKDIHLKGKLNLSARVKNNQISAYTELKNFELFYKPKNLKYDINSGSILLQNNTLNLNKISSHLGQMPVFINGKIYDVQKNPNLNLYLNAKPTQDFFDQFFNNKSLYPIKLKGDAILTSKINGKLNSINSKSIIDIKEDSSIYYMGATIGDNENPVKITIDSTSLPNSIKINNFQYDKIINSQNNKPFVNTQLTASGLISLLPDNNIKFNNLRIKTHNPTDAKIFNIIFRKPFMKQGIFTSDLILNGTSYEPKILGTFEISSIDIPFFDTSIRDVNLEFHRDRINATGRGTVLTNDLNLKAVLKNKLTPPYIIEDATLKLSSLDINKITNTITELEADAAGKPTAQTNKNQNIDLSQIIIQNSEIFADKIKVRNIDANNFSSKLKLNDKMLLNVEKFQFEIAQGSVLGSFQHNLLNRKTNLDIKLHNANALVMSEALFDLKGQIYGSVNGEFYLVCNGTSQESCFKTLNGSGNFNVRDGKMPKLGSLEYLLKAGNLIKSGFTGLSINSIVDLITPLKTGNFESISGNIQIKNGVADKIDIYSSGHDLNMYMTGSYNIVSSFADMKIYGSLSKNITTMFGKIKNASLNTLFNTIPGITNSNGNLLMQEEIKKIPNIKDVTDIYRIFAVDVNGDINGENYVKSFRWVK